MNNNYEQEISLKELITVILSGWKLIAVVSLVGVVLAVVYSLFIAEEVFETKADVFFDIPEEVKTEFGKYQFVSDQPNDYFNAFTNQQVIEKTMDDMKIAGDINRIIKKFKIDLADGKDKERGLIKISYRGGDKNKIPKVLDAHVNNYSSFLNYRIKQMAIEKFLLTHNNSLSINENSLKFKKIELAKAEKLLESTAKVMPLHKVLKANSKDANDSELSLEVENNKDSKAGNFTNNMFLDEVLIGDYVITVSRVTEIKEEINKLEIDIEKSKEQIKKLKQEKENLEKAGIFANYSSPSIEILNLSVNQLTSASIPLQRIAPKRAIIVAIAFVLSIILGIFIVLFRNYWKNN